jgi:hypothetical protein
VALGDKNSIKKTVAQGCHSLAASMENYLCRQILIGCTMGSRKLRLLKSSPILLAYIALLGLMLVCRI